MLDYTYRERGEGEGPGKRKKKLPNMWRLEADNNEVKELTKCFK